MCESACKVVNEESVVLAEVGDSEDVAKFCLKLACNCVQCECAKNGLPSCCAKKQ